MKEQSQKHARKHIKGGCYLKVTLGHRGLTFKFVVKHTITFYFLFKFHNMQALFSLIIYLLTYLLTYLVSYLFTPYSTLLLEKLTG
jgi:hypothetical protein